MITKRSEYAIRAVWELSRAGGELITASAVAEAQHIPPKYLPQIVAELVQAGILASSRGYKGGLRLRKGAEDVTLLEIIEAVQGKLDLFECQHTTIDCEHLPDCVLRGVYNQAQGALENVLSATRLVDIQLGDKKRGNHGK